VNRERNIVGTSLVGKWDGGVKGLDRALEEVQNWGEALKQRTAEKPATTKEQSEEQ